MRRESPGKAFEVVKHTDPYACLGVPRNADASAIRKAYFRLVRVHTPEDDPERFVEISAAYELLADPGLRAEFDAHESVPAAVQVALVEAEELLEEHPQRAARRVRPLAVDPNQPEVVRFAAATILARAGEVERAIPTLDELVARHPGDAGYVCALVRCLRELRKFASARQHLVRAIQQTSGEPALYIALSQVYNAAEKHERADEILRKGLDVVGAAGVHSLGLHFQRILTLANDDQPDDLVAVARAVAACIPEGDDDARIHVVSRYIALGNTFYEYRRFSAAHFCFEQACRLDPDDAALRQHCDQLADTARAQHEAIAVLDDRQIASWIKALLAIRFGPGLDQQTIDELCEAAVETHRSSPKQARVHWQRFSNHYPAAATELEPLRRKIWEASRATPAPAGARGATRRGQRDTYAQMAGAIGIFVVLVGLWALLGSKGRPARTNGYNPTSPAYTRRPLGHDLATEEGIHRISRQILEDAENDPAAFRRLIDSINTGNSRRVWEPETTADDTAPGDAAPDTETDEPE